MEIIAKINKFDADMVELYAEGKKTLLGVVHIDSFFERGVNNGIYTRVREGELVLDLQIKTWEGK